MSKVAKKKVPTLRFPGFSDEWQRKRLGDITKINQGLQIAISERYESKIHGSYFYITNEFLKSGSKKKYFIKDPPNSVIAHTDDLLMTRTGNTGTVITGVHGAFHNNFFKIKRDEKDISKGFLYYFLTSRPIQNLILRLAGTSTIPDLNHGDFYKIPIILPQTVEQQKIAGFLTVVDERIELMEKKLSLAKKYKKALMQKLFPRSGETNPTLRFKKDDGSDFPDWRPTKMSQVLQESKVKGSGGDTAKKITVKLWGKGVYAKEEVNKGSSATQYYVRSAGQFIYSKLDFLNCAFGVIPQELNGYESTADLPCFDFKHQYSHSLILELAKQKSFYKRLGETADGSRKAKRIHIDTFLSFEMLLPDYEEQKKIADFLSGIDIKITEQERNLEQAKQFKKALLQQLFV